jgi:hypothetical protein
MAHSKSEKKKIMIMMTIFTLVMGMIIGVANDYSDWGTAALMLFFGAMVPLGSKVRDWIKKYHGI